VRTPDSENVLEPLDVEVEQLGTEAVLVCIPPYPAKQADDRIQITWGGIAYPFPDPEAVDPKFVLEIDVAGREKETGRVEVKYVVKRS
jgi:hypothetical protein